MLDCLSLSLGTYQQTAHLAHTHFPSTQITYSMYALNSQYGLKAAGRKKSSWLWDHMQKIRTLFRNSNFQSAQSISWISGPVTEQLTLQ